LAGPGGMGIRTGSSHSEPVARHLIEHPERFGAVDEYHGSGQPLSISIRPRASVNVSDAALLIVLSDGPEFRAVAWFPACATATERSAGTGRRLDGPRASWPDIDEDISVAP